MKGLMQHVHSLREGNVVHLDPVLIVIDTLDPLNVLFVLIILLDLLDQLGSLLGTEVGGFDEVVWVEGLLEGVY